VAYARWGEGEGPERLGGSTWKIRGNGLESNLGQRRIVEERRDRKTSSKELQSEEEREREGGDRRRNTRGETQRAETGGDIGGIRRRGRRPEEI